MSAPSDLSYDEILKFMLEHNGRVTNFELVKHFKVFLMNPDTRDEARSMFKKHVNTLANIKTQNNEKWIILRKKFLPPNGKENEDVNENKITETQNFNVSETTEDTEMSQIPPPRPPLPVQLNQDFSIINNLIENNPKTPVTPVTSQIFPSESKESLISVQSDDVPPKVHPRRKSSADKVTLKPAAVLRSELQSQGSSSSIANDDVSELNETSSTLTSSRSESTLVESEQKISVKERKQMFNRMASESDVLKPNKLGSFGAHGVDEEDRGSLDQKSEEPFDPKQKQWILCAAKGEYHALAKMCKDNAKLARTKDPFTGYTAMHWACKRGDENLVKLLAGVARHVVNERSNGGYTPLHLAMQYRHENVYKLLVEAYDADSNIRDWSGRKPRQYLAHMDTSLSPGSYRKKEGFLRIGSLNVRVKKTTEAFSNFLGVGATRSSAYIPKSSRHREHRQLDDYDQVHKSWGSADNIQKEDNKVMPPPMSSKVRRRGNSGRRNIGASHSRSTPSTPDQPRAHIGENKEGDSDSDSAAGFHSAWRQQRASHCT